jgi:hypothetical protein
MAVLVVAAVQASTLLNFLMPSGAALLAVFAMPAPLIVLWAEIRLRSEAPFAIALAMTGALCLGIFAPIYALDRALAVEGERTVATVSKVDTTTSRHGTRSYTVWLTDGYGKPIERPLINSPRRVGDEVEVLFDPHGLVPTETANTITRSWPLPATLVSALATIAGLAIMARRWEE